MKSQTTLSPTDTVIDLGEKELSLTCTVWSAANAAPAAHGRSSTPNIADARRTERNPTRVCEAHAVDGIHDLGGLAGFGFVERTPAEATFAEDWERRAFRANMAVMTTLHPSGGAFRHSIERMDPTHYLSSSYYEHWLTGSSTLLVEAGVVTREELDRRAGGRFPLSRPDRGTPPSEEQHDRVDPRFAVGDEVRVREWHAFGHTRAPRYVQGKRGTVVRVDDPANVPDVEAHSVIRVLDPTYSVRFTTAELWGEASVDTIHVDVWERYLEDAR